MNDIEKVDANLKNAKTVELHDLLRNSGSITKPGRKNSGKRRSSGRASPSRTRISGRPSIP